MKDVNFLAGVTDEVSNYQANIEQDTNIQTHNPFTLYPDPEVRVLEMGAYVRTIASIRQAHFRLSGDLWEEIVSLEQELNELRSLRSRQGKAKEGSEEVLWARIQEIKAADRKERYLNGLLRKRVAEMLEEANRLREDISRRVSGR